MRATVLKACPPGRAWPPKRPRTRFLALWWCLGFFAVLSLQASQPTAGLEFIVGTWTGTSTCLGDRPACKNETVVYRFVPVEGHPGQVRQLADKILDGKRVPMGALTFDVDERSRTLRSEFTVGKTHGVWTYTVVAADSMTGKLMILPDRSIGRDVKVHRANDREVPEAPPFRDYDE